jgi:hypothetical protein
MLMTTYWFASCLDYVILKKRIILVKNKKVDRLNEIVLLLPLDKIARNQACMSDKRMIVY